MERGPENLKHGGPFNPTGAHIADFNGDGRADVLFQGVDNRFWLSLSNGDGTFHNTWKGDQENLKHGGPFNPAGAHIADFNGDGRADVLFQGVDNRFWLSFRMATGTFHNMWNGDQESLRNDDDKQYTPSAVQLADVNGA